MPSTIRWLWSSVFSFKNTSGALVPPLPVCSKTGEIAAPKGARPAGGARVHGNAYRRTGRRNAAALLRLDSCKTFVRFPTRPVGVFHEANTRGDSAFLAVFSRRDCVMRFAAFHLRGAFAASQVFCAATSSIIGRRNSSRIPSISSMRAGGCGSTTRRRAKPWASKPSRMVVSV